MDNFFSSRVEWVFALHWKLFMISLCSFLFKTLIGWTVERSCARTFLVFFSKIWGYISLNSIVSEFLLWNFMSRISKWPMLSSWERRSRMRLNSDMLDVLILLIQPYGRGLVMAWAYWLFSSIFSIFVVILFLIYIVYF